MAEGLLRHIAGERYESLSAGVCPAGFVHPLAVRVLEELGIDISTHRSKSVREFLPPRGPAPDVIVSLCDLARGWCPALPATLSTVHWPVYDPILAEGDEAARLAVFRRVRDEIRARIEDGLRNGDLDRGGSSKGPISP